MGKLPPRARLFVFVTWMVGGSLGVASLLHVRAVNPALFAATVVITAGLQAFAVVGATEKTSYNTALVGYAFALAMWGAPEAAVVIVAACVVEWIVHRLTWYTQLFNIASLFIATACAGLVQSPVAPGLPLSDPRRFGALAVACVVFAVVNHVLVGAVVYLVHGERPVESGVMRLLTILIDATLLAMGATVALLWTISPIASLLALLPLYLLHSALRIPTIERKADEQLSQDLLVVLSKAVDLRDPFVFGHSRHVAEYAELIAREMGLGEARIKAIHRAGLLHDIGKLGIPEAILLKTSRLDDHEYAVMRTHPACSAELLKGSRSLRPLVPIVKHHHERWDGSGYPDGIAGKLIPLEARILALADAVDAMASDRSYRRGLTPPEVLLEVRACSESQFDPRVVEAFAAVLEREGESAIVNSAHLVMQETTHQTLPYRTLPTPEPGVLVGDLES